MHHLLRRTTFHPLPAVSSLDHVRRLRAEVDRSLGEPQAELSIVLPADRAPLLRRCGGGRGLATGAGAPAHL